MLMEKPQCNFKNCRYCFDGNCFSADKYENCELTDLHCEIAKLRVDLDNAKTEVAREIFEEIEKTIRAALVLVGFSYKHNVKEMECKKECYEDFLGYIAELKKKYGV